MTLVMATTNGSQALVAAQHCGPVFVGAVINFSAVAAAARAAFEEAAIAALQLVRRYGEKWKTAVNASAAARRLKELGMAQDVAAATDVDKFDIVPLYAERQVKV